MADATIQDILTQLFSRATPVISPLLTQPGAFFDLPSIREVNEDGDDDNKGGTPHPGLAISLVWQIDSTLETVKHLLNQVESLAPHGGLIIDETKIKLDELLSKVNELETTLANSLTDEEVTADEEESSLFDPAFIRALQTSQLIPRHDGANVSEEIVNTTNVSEVDVEDSTKRCQYIFVGGMLKGEQCAEPVVGEAPFCTIHERSKRSKRSTSFITPSLSGESESNLINKNRDEESRGKNQGDNDDEREPFCTPNDDECGVDTSVDK